MNVDDALRDVSRLFLDTAPVIYYVEGVPRYMDVARKVFGKISRGEIEAVASPVTLAECLVVPLRSNQAELVRKFKLVLAPPNTAHYVSLDRLTESAAKYCADYRLRLPDGFQLAAASSQACDAILTNDKALKRVSGIRVLLLDDLSV
jgi:predicted nucleic acid-binding protein